MKTFSLALVTSLIAASAFAGNSDRYNDLRLDTRIGHLSDHQDRTAADGGSAFPGTPVTFSTRNAQADGPSYPYINPLGVGPYNDSR